MKQFLVDMVQQMSVTELYEIMFTDTVTGVLNRTAFDKCAPYQVIAIIDLDSLKYLNDKVDHREGDKFLRYLAQKLAIHFNRDDVYRLSGDEFVVTGSSFEVLQTALSELQDLYPIFSFGVHIDLVRADAVLTVDKQQREASGLRAARGECPPWFEKIKLV